MHAPHASRDRLARANEDRLSPRGAGSLFCLIRLARLSRLIFALSLPLCLAPSVAAQRRVSRDPVAVDREDASEGEDAAKPNNSTVRGRVVFGETGRPVRRARVMLVEERTTTQGAGTTSQAVTNARGEFEFKRVRAGHYFVAVVAPGVLTPFSFAIGNLRAEVQPVGNASGELKKYFDEVSVDGTSDAELNVKARRGAAISGRATYEDGAPAIGATVSLYRKVGGAFTRAGAPQQADDRGIYRFTGLPPGEYVVGVTEMVVHGDAGVGRASMMMYAGGAGALVSTFYPAATNIHAATPLAVELGEEREGTDIAVVERELHTLSGTVRSHSGSKPVAGVKLTITAADSQPGRADYTSTMPDAETDEQGRFTLREIPEGDYVINVRPTADVDATQLLAPLPKPKPSPTADADGEGDEEDYRAPLQRYTAKQQRVKVAGADVDNLDITINEGAFVTGTVILQGGKGEPRYVNVSATRVGGTGNENGEGSTYLQGQFALSGLSAGRYFLSVNAADEDGNDYYVKSMTYNGADLTREPLSIEEGATLHGVRIVLAADMGTLTGRVLTGEHAPAPGARVICVPTDAMKWPTPDGQSQDFAEATGKFETDLAPGDYFVFALAPGGGRQPLSPDEIKTRAAQAQRVTVRPAQTTTTEIILRPDN
jgi:hypothetical protein